MNQEILSDIFQRNVALMNNSGVVYQQWHHEPILDFATDEQVGKRLGWTATATKSLFLSFKSGEYALLLTHKEARLDSKKIKSVIGKRPSIASDDEMIRELGCVPGAVCPFGIPAYIPLLVDETLFGFDSLMYTPGPPEYTFAFAAKDLPVLLSALANPIHILSESIAQ